MSPKSPIKRLARQSKTAWVKLCFGSLILSGSTWGLAQEPAVPKVLEPPSIFNHNPASQYFPKSGVPSEKSTDFMLPPFPAEPGHHSATENVMALQPVSFPTSLPVSEQRHGSADGIVLALEPSSQDQETSPQSTRATVGPWTLKSINELELAVHSSRRRPENAAETVVGATISGSGPNLLNVGTVASWIAPNVVYQPLLFEDARLERYGYASPYFGIQPARSGVHFASSSLLFPVRVWWHRNECESPLAFERPGSCAPTMKEVFVPAATNLWNRP